MEIAHKEKLFKACQNGESQVVLELILEDKSFFYLRNEQERTILHVAALYGHEQLVKMIVEREPEKKGYLELRDYNEQTALFNAVLMRKLNIVQYLIGRGCKKDLIDFRGYTAAEAAGFNSDFAILQFLASQGVPIEYNKMEFGSSKIGYSGWTILHIAALHAKLGFVRFLIQHGACVNAVDAYGNAPLHYAVESIGADAFAIAKLLIKNGADVNFVNNVKESPLHVAAKLGKDYLVRFFVDHGGNIFFKNNNGKRAISLARECEEIRRNNIGSCSNYLENAIKSHEDIKKFLDKLKGLQIEYDIKNKITSQMNKIKVKIKDIKNVYTFHTLNKLVFYNSKKVKELLLFKKELAPISRQYAIHVILLYGLHKKYPNLFSLGFIKNTVKDVSLKTFLLKNPEFMEIILRQAWIPDSNGFFPYQKIAYYTKVLPVILARYPELYKNNEHMKRVLFGDLQFEQEVLPICSFLARSLQFARRKRLKKYHDCFQIFRDLERKIRSYNKIKKVEIKNSQQLVSHILQYCPEYT